MTDSISITNPMEEGTKLHSNMDTNYIDKKKYHILIGSLIYLVNSRPNKTYCHRNTYNYLYE